MKFAYWTSLALLAVASIEVQAQDRQPQYEDSQVYQQYQAPRRPQQYAQQRTRPVQYRKVVAPQQQDDFAQFEGSPYLKSNSQMQMKVKPRASMLHLEPVFGANQSTFEGVQGANGSKIENMNGYQAGMNVLMGSSNTQFETGLHYAQRGAKHTNTTGRIYGTYTKMDLTYQFKYLEIPAMARYNFSHPSRSGFFVKGGAVLGLLTEATGKTENVQNTFGYTTPGDANIKDLFNETDLRLAMGAGGTLRFSKTMAATLGLDYQRSLSKINKKDIKDINQNNLEFLNSTMQLNAGLIFDL